MELLSLATNDNWQVVALKKSADDESGSSLQKTNRNREFGLWLARKCFLCLLSLVNFLEDSNSSRLEIINNGLGLSQGLETTRPKGLTIPKGRPLFAKNTSTCGLVCSSVSSCCKFAPRQTINESGSSAGCTSSAFVMSKVVLIMLRERRRSSKHQEKNSSWRLDYLACRARL